MSSAKLVMGRAVVVVVEGIAAVEVGWLAVVNGVNTPRANVPPEGHRLRWNVAPVWVFGGLSSTSREPVAGQAQALPPSGTLALVGHAHWSALAAPAGANFCWGHQTCPPPHGAEVGGQAPRAHAPSGGVVVEPGQTQALAPGRGRLGLGEAVGGARCAGRAAVGVVVPARGAGLALAQPPRVQGVGWHVPEQLATVNAVKAGHSMRTRGWSATQ